MTSFSMISRRRTSFHGCVLTTLALALVSLTGCVGPMACGPLALGGGCGGTSCGDGCGGGGALGSSGCRLFAGNCGGCDSCSGCGELYIDPWINEPANTYDPCDCCGNFNGQSCGGCRPIFNGLKTLWGYKYNDGCGCGGGGCDGGCGGGECGAGGCDSGGCSSCGGGGDYDGAINYSHGGESFVQGEPTLAHNGQSISVSPRGQSFQPEHTRKIFNPKKNVPARPVSMRSVAPRTH